MPVRFSLVAGEGPSARPSEIVAALGIPAAAARIVRRETRFKNGLFGLPAAATAAARPEASA